jgi:hypothetical protein
MIIYFQSYHCCLPLEKMYLSRGRLQFKKGRMMRTSLHHIQDKERRTIVGIQLVFIMVEA